MALRSRAYLLLIISLPLLVSAQQLSEVQRLEEGGKFNEAGSLLHQMLDNKELAPDVRKELEFELDRLDRIRLDYSLTEEKLFSQLVRSVKDLTREEFVRWVKEGRFDRRMIDGEARFVGVSRSNLFFRYPDVVARRISPPDETGFEKAVWENCRRIKSEAEEKRTPYVLPTRFAMTMNVTVEPGVVPAGDTIRAWLPIPRSFPFQKDFLLVSASSGVRHIAPEESPIRSLYIEQQSAGNQPTRIKAEYMYTTRGSYFSLDPSKVEHYRPGDEETYTQEGPHVVFTERMRKLSQEIAGNESNPLLRARRFYEWISGRIKYSYAIEYSTIRNIGEYCATKMYGDCGQEALLFITLCRLNGIPARWQSGWFTFPGGKTIHDWTEIYVRPWGWIPVDPYMGIFATLYLNSLTDEQKREVRDFYFGGLDQYRMSANSDHSQTLNPPKQSFRSDNVDFQRGELEHNGKNIYFNKYDYELLVKEIIITP